MVPLKGCIGVTQWYIPEVRGTFLGGQHDKGYNIKLWVPCFRRSHHNEDYRIKSGVPFWGVTIIRIVVYGGLY